MFNGEVGDNSTGGFFQNYVVDGETLDYVSDIDLTRVGGAGSTLYEGIATNPLLIFSDGVKFVADNPFNLVRSGSFRLGDWWSCLNLKNLFRRVCECSG